MPHPASATHPTFFEFAFTVQKSLVSSRHSSLAPFARKCFNIVVMEHIHRRKIYLLIVFCLLLSSCTKNPISSHNGEDILAAFNKNKIDELARSLRNDAELINIKSNDVKLNGTSKSWIHIYYSVSSHACYYFHTTYNEAIFDSSSNQLVTGSTFITHNWFNSDEAIRIAEKNSGEDFRMKNPGYSIEASLAEPLVPDSSTYWYITYRSRLDRTESLMLGVDARTGEVTLRYP